MTENRINKKGRKRLEKDTLGQGKRKNASVPRMDENHSDIGVLSNYQDFV